MFRYLAFVWNDRDAAARESARSLLQRQSAAGRDWRVGLRGQGVEVRYLRGGADTSCAYELAEGDGVVLGNLFARSPEGVSTRGAGGARGRRQPRAARHQRPPSHRELLGTLRRLPARRGGGGHLGGARPFGRAAVLSRALPRGRCLLLVDRRHRRSARCAPRGQLAVPDRLGVLSARAFTRHRPAPGHPGAGGRVRGDARRRRQAVLLLGSAADRRQRGDRGSAAGRRGDAPVRARRRPCLGVAPRARAALALRRPRLLDRARLPAGRPDAAAGLLFSLLPTGRRPRRARVRARRGRQGGARPDRAAARPVLQPAAAARACTGRRSRPTIPTSSSTAGSMRSSPPSRAPARSSSAMAAISSSTRSAPNGRPGISSTAAGRGPAVLRVALDAAQMDQLSVWRVLGQAMSGYLLQQRWSVLQEAGRKRPLLVAAK